MAQKKKKILIPRMEFTEKCPIFFFSSLCMGKVKKKKVYGYRFLYNFCTRRDFQACELKIMKKFQKYFYNLTTIIMEFVISILKDRYKIRNLGNTSPTRTWPLCYILYIIYIYLDIKEISLITT